MRTQIDPGSVLLVSGSEKGAAALLQLLPHSSDTRPTAVSSAGEARRLLLAHSFDLIVVNAPLSDEPGTELAIHAAETTSAGVLLLVRADVLETAAEQVEDYGVFTVPKPIQRQAVLQALRLAWATRARLRRLEQENRRLSEKLSELRAVSRAKWLLIEREHMTEADAHRHIEKTAMDSRRTRRQVAEDIIDKYN